MDCKLNFIVKPQANRKKIFPLRRKSNIFDNMMALMEKYAFNLEELVQQRTNQLSEEKKKTENLLLRMLPRYSVDSFMLAPFDNDIF